jgi:quinol-cytochrome oxidoreductase complex cytochrome b subunit
MHPSNSFMDGSVIGNILPVFGILVAAFRVVILRGKFQTLIPTVSEEGTSPMRTLLLSHILFLFLHAHLFFMSPLLLFVLMLLVALLFLLTLPLVEENTRSHPGFRGFTHFNLTLQKARLSLVDLFKCYLSSGVN